MIIIKRWYKVFKQYVGRFRYGQASRIVRTLTVDSAGGKLRPGDRGVAYRSPSEASGPSSIDIHDQDHPSENRPLLDEYPISTVNSVVRHTTNQDIDSSGFDTLEAYAEGLSISEETISKWVSAGILSPGETEVAEKVIRIMRKNVRQGS
jgi:hypothetical protein